MSTPADPASTVDALETVFANHQFGIYGAGMSGQRPALPVTPDALEARAEAEMTPQAFGYVAGGAGAEHTVRANREAFGRWRIVPRMLRDVSERDLSTTVLGTAMTAPVLLSPVGVLSIVHPDAELAVARAAAARGLPFILSTAGSNTTEAVAEAAGDGARWYQLYWPKSRELAASFVQRAEAAGYGALVVTLDTWLLGWRPRDLQQAYLPFLQGHGVATYFADPVFRGLLDATPEEDPGAAIGQWANQFANPAVNWDDLTWLREQTSMPIVLKGIQHEEDAARALDLGVDGILVSNHGGRQVDRAIGALDALPGIRDVVGPELPLLFDSGVRTGADGLIALALGADAVCLGRPWVYGLGLGGEEGVGHVLDCFLAELDLQFALSGQTRVADVTRDLLTRA